MDENSFLIILLSLLFSAFFSGMEIAFISSNKLKIELDKKGGEIAASIYSYFVKHEREFISTMLIGNNIALVIYGYFMALALEPLIAAAIPNKFAIFLLQTVISTTLVLVTAEFLPKTIFRINPNRTLNVFAIPTVIIYSVLSPIVFITMGITNFILKYIIKEDLSNKQVVFGKVDLDQYLREATSKTNNKDELEHEVQILQNALEFNEVKVRECMVPRTEVKAVSEDEELEKVRELFIETGLSKVLIYREGMDNIIGYVHSFELLKSPKSIKEILLPISLIPEAMTASDALKILNKNKRSIAVVLDEFGGTAGIVTTEDLIEEIVGEIEDEHDKDYEIEEDLGEGRYRFSARLEVDHLNMEYQLELPENPDYETLGGLITHFQESIPDQGEVLEIEGFIFTIEQVSDNKIESVLITNSPPN
ncbi:MAG: hemolysin [Crocinitomicaceae bacterium]|nr:hemolysin [Crocinitomicaceae bacterium]|tara:strand:+ start:15300 stop:16565 length:1266 start_codon:yes stop_codon:yes gene_type:complete